MKEDTAKKMAKLLHQGATMLDDYCPKCGKILFRLKTGQILCPSCELDVNSETKPSLNENLMNKTNENENQRESIHISEILEIKISILNILRKKLKNMENEDDPSAFEKELNNLILLVDLIKKITPLNQFFTN